MHILHGCIYTKAKKHFKLYKVSTHTKHLHCTHTKPSIKTDIVSPNRNVYRYLTILEPEITMVITRSYTYPRYNITAFSTGLDKYVSQSPRHIVQRVSCKGYLPTNQSWAIFTKWVDCQELVGEVYQVILSTAALR